MGTKTAKLILLIQKELEEFTENITIAIIKRLEKKGMWY